MSILGGKLQIAVEENQHSIIGYSADPLNHSLCIIYAQNGKEMNSSCAFLWLNTSRLFSGVERFSPFFKLINMPTHFVHNAWKQNSGNVYIYTRKLSRTYVLISRTYVLISRPYENNYHVRTY